MPSLRSTAFAPAVLAVLLLSGCAAGATTAAETGEPAPKPTEAAEAPATAPAEGATEQSVEEACALLATGVQPFVEMSSDGQDATAKAAQDPQGTIAKIRGVADTFSASVDQVTNPEVLPVATTASAALDSYADALDAIIADPLNADVAGVAQEQAQSIGQAFSAIGDVCS
ncbi:hypothetical protein [Agromyces sp. Leaf222]|uniref:hypothetical protein n=1 Tax=Agromyces sp. Leaf222 TaxID=1735688 RepID=UPI0006F70F3F|nr:hypothetical protein [Agromyces sp. Leaf222]KQM80703.1 hypothetical protein ASE68_19415 [Agromyces sp. Leaf222]